MVDLLYSPQEGDLQQQQQQQQQYIDNLSKWSRVWGHVAAISKKCRKYKRGLVVCYYC